VHELSIAESMMDQLTALARREGALSIDRVTVCIGALAGVDPDALELAFPVAAEGTVARDATLDIERFPARIRCRDCGVEHDIDEPCLLCPDCASTHVEIVSGRDLTLKSVALNLRAEAKESTER